jgi:2'-5' RNA ligase
VQATLDGLQRNDPNLQTHALAGALKGWYSTKASRGHRIVHQPTDDGGLYIGGVSLHEYPNQRFGAHGYVTSDNGDGVMIALVPPPRVAEAIVQEDGEPASNLHITLAYLGKASEMEPQDLTYLPEIVRAWAEAEEPLSIGLQGTGTFTPSEEGGQHVLWAAVAAKGINLMHERLVNALEHKGYEPHHDHEFHPHLTLAYSKYDVRFHPKVPRLSWEADEVWLCIAGEWRPFPLGTS